jgi:hypothetical protein
MGAPACPGNCEKSSLPIWPLKLRWAALGLSTISPLLTALVCDRLPDRTERVDRRFSSFLSLSLSLLFLRSFSSRSVELDDSV